MKAALLAKFAQHDNLRRRLLALTAKNTVEGMPDGLIEATADEFIKCQAGHNSRTV